VSNTEVIYTFTPCIPCQPGGELTGKTIDHCTNPLLPPPPTEMDEPIAVMLGALGASAPCSPLVGNAVALSTLGIEGPAAPPPSGDESSCGATLPLSTASMCCGVGSCEALPSMVEPLETMRFEGAETGVAKA
jgi:hypothetical protein